MAPWAYDNVRLALDQIKPPLDIFPLGKVLWSMISGRNGFPFWEFDAASNNLAKLFPGDPTMHLVNDLLRKCIVRYEKDCVPTAADLLSEMDGLTQKLKARDSFRADGATTWPCRVCGRGIYQDGNKTVLLKERRHVGGIQVVEVPVKVFICNHCGHTQFFASQ